MPIYEFFCPQCNTLFTFFSKTVNTEKRPLCPRCRETRLQRQMSVFSKVRRADSEEEPAMPDMDEGRLERAMGMLASEAEGLDENDPKQAARLMRKLTDMTGLQLGNGMEEALRRMEAGEDPEAVEAEMGDVLESEDPFALKSKARGLSTRPAPFRDEKLYDLD
jgi:putative FmdB family regulatory protein